MTSDFSRSCSATCLAKNSSDTWKHILRGCEALQMILCMAGTAPWELATYLDQVPESALQRLEEATWKVYIVEIIRGISLHSHAWMVINHAGCSSSSCLGNLSCPGPWAGPLSYHVNCVRAWCVHSCMDRTVTLAFQKPSESWSSNQNEGQHLHEDVIV